MEGFLQTVSDSYAKGEAARLERIARGDQPEFPYTNELIIGGNIVYFLVTFLLYSYMSKREKGFELKPVLTVYNMICVFLAGYVVYGTLKFKLKIPGKFVCNEDISSTPEAKEFAWYFYIFFLQKFWEFFDTWFFILRKSFRQVTLLHIYHHSSITFTVGVIMQYDYFGDMFLPLFLNSFIHVLMYSHYLVTSFGIKGWWSKYLTSMQLIQFILIASQSGISMYRGESCGPPLFVNLTIVVYMVTMLVLFGNFFVQRYLKKPTSTTKNGTHKKDQ